MQRLIWIIIAIAIILLDQYTKWLVVEQIMFPTIHSTSGSSLIDWYLNPAVQLPFIHIPVASNFNLVMAWNTGVSFSLFSDMGVYAVYTLIGLSIIITCFFSYWLYRATSNLQGLCFALVIGGAVGNVIDRIRFHAVIDFLDFHIYGHHWPAFNVADISIVCGISMLIIISLFFDITDNNSYVDQRKK